MKDYVDWDDPNDNDPPIEKPIKPTDEDRGRTNIPS